MIIGDERFLFRQNKVAKKLEFDGNITNINQLYLKI